jgi:pimeloyl-ACP methyl ester carboxylesterase
MARLHLVSEKRVEGARQRYGSADYQAATGVMRQILVRLVAERYEEMLAAITCPVDLVWGDNDTAAPASIATALAALLPQVTLTWCPGAGHLTPLSAPEALRRAVDRQLGR